MVLRHHRRWVTWKGCADAFHASEGPRVLKKGSIAAIVPIVARNGDKGPVGSTRAASRTGDAGSYPVSATIDLDRRESKFAIT